MIKRVRTIFFVGGMLLPPFDMINFQANCHFTREMALKMFVSELEARAQNNFIYEGLTILNDVAAAALYRDEQAACKIAVVASGAPSTFEIHVSRLMGDSIPDQAKMTELVHAEMCRQDVGGWSMSEPLELKEVSIALVQC